MSVAVGEFVESYKDLIVYQKARAVAKAIYVLTQSFLNDEKYALTDQIRRSSRSIGAQIAEAWGKRQYIRHFISKLSDADGEQFETQHWIDCASDCGLISLQQAQEINSQLAEINRMLHAMMTKAHLFCKPTDSYLKESVVYDDLQ